MAVVKTCDYCGKEIRRTEPDFECIRYSHHVHVHTVTPRPQFLIRQPGCIDGTREFEFCSGECLLAAERKHYGPKEDEIIDLE